MNSSINSGIHEVNKNLFENYFNQNMTDEMFDRNGQINSHWQTISQNIQKIGRDGLVSRLSDIKWHLAENGVTYNVCIVTGKQIGRAHV